MDDLDELEARQPAERSWTDGRLTTRADTVQTMADPALDAENVGLSMERTKRRASHRGRQGSVGLSNGSSRWNVSLSDEDDDEAVVRPKASRESLGYDDEDLDLEMQVDALAKELDPTVLSTFTILWPLRRCCRVMFSYGASWSR